MRLAVLGGSDKTGRQFVRQALRHGYEVTMLTGQPAPNLIHENLSVVVGSPQNEADVTQALANAHAVISLPDTSFTPHTLHMLVACMYAYDLKRLIVATHLDALKPAQNEPSVAEVLQQTSLDWTVVHSASAALLNADFLQDHPSLAVSAKDFGKFMVQQVTDVAHLQSAVILSN